MFTFFTCKEKMCQSKFSFGKGRDTGQYKETEKKRREKEIIMLLTTALTLF